MNKYLKDKENKPFIDNARFKRIGTTDRTSSPINLILTKMRQQQSPHLSARTPKDCQSRISNECEQQLQSDSILEMEERKRKIRKFKQCLTENIEKLKELDSISQQILSFEDCLNSILKKIKIIKSEIQEQFKLQQINQKKIFIKQRNQQNKCQKIFNQMRLMLLSKCK
ncbi:unnamed protein product [Paramecium pentaurelia]|uniref:Uncharacterized protein n=1 Tax=Paramecium pentaurelia TaxID=43138 RepID=A0A8S1VG83_9CILI|nr:unnamed protein product [Paramecium pentaurelia]